MILDRDCYPVIHFSVGSYYRYDVAHQYSVCLSLSGPLSSSAVSSPDAPLLIHSSYHLFKTLDFFSGEGVLAH